MTAGQGASGMESPAKDSVAAAEDLIERSAKAFITAIPQQPEDDGYFGPASITWRLAADLSAPVAGLRALLMQALHPLAMAGVDQHSGWRRDPAGRLAATSAYLATLTFGDRATADRAAAQVRRIHDHVRGTDPVTGRPYAASDPALLLWVHATFVDSGLAAARAFGTPPSDAEAKAYIRETRIYAEVLGVPRDIIPADQRGLAEYVSSVVPELMNTPAAEEAAGYLLDPPNMDPAVADLWQELRDAVLAVLPDWALDRYGYGAPPPLTAERRDEIRGALGMFDAVLLGEPGVLEARQRITLRMRG